MPKSKSWGKEWVDAIYAHLHTAGAARRVIDIGVGRGTFSKRLRAHPGVEWVGVEAWEPYVEAFALREKYDRLIVGDVRAIAWDELGRFDVAFLGDVLEHMSGPDAVVLVHRVLDAGATAFVSIPIAYLPQGRVDGNPFEEHVKPDWSHEEVMLAIPCVRVSYREGFLGIYACASPGAPTRALEEAFRGVPVSVIGETARVEWEGERGRPSYWRRRLMLRRISRLVLGRTEDRHRDALGFVRRVARRPGA